MSDSDAVRDVALSLAFGLYASDEGDRVSRARAAASAYVRMAGERATLSLQAPPRHEDIAAFGALADSALPLDEAGRRVLQASIAESELSLALDAYALTSRLGSRTVCVKEIRALYDAGEILALDRDEILNALAWIRFSLSARFATGGASHLRGQPPFSDSLWREPEPFDYTQARAHGWEALPPAACAPSFQTSAKHQVALSQLFLLAASARSRVDTHVGLCEETWVVSERITLPTWMDLHRVIERDLTPVLADRGVGSERKAREVARTLAFYRYRVSSDRQKGTDPFLCNASLEHYRAAVSRAFSEDKRNR